MGFSNSNIIILLCIFLIVNGCNQTIPKIIVEKQNPNKLIKDKQKKTSKNNYFSEKIIKKKIGTSKNTTTNQLNDNDVVFEFRNERLLQGQVSKKPLQNKKLVKLYLRFLKC